MSTLAEIAQQLKDSIEQKKEMIFVIRLRIGWERKRV